VRNARLIDAGCFRDLCRDEADGIHAQLLRLADHTANRTSDAFLVDLVPAAETGQDDPLDG
jgi:hypothetical protein